METPWWCTGAGDPLPCFSKVFILKEVKVVCFDTVLEVLILKVVRGCGATSRRTPKLGGHSGNCQWRENLRRRLGGIKTSQLAGAPKPGGTGGGVCGAGAGTELFCEFWVVGDC
jgi:hypothetical protein